MANWHTHARRALLRRALPRGTLPRVALPRVALPGRTGRPGRTAANGLFGGLAGTP
ncbi:hypothetical protein [Sporomusa acidovorans]|uniref:hypothetical protein n=1 Tax=Sporomusa acidovorans TaxID=112900 RepID=UPI00146D7A1C|nr:hypothetical protein [Sporomusa acidovorans]